MDKAEIFESLRQKSWAELEKILTERQMTYATNLVKSGLDPQKAIALSGWPKGTKVHDMKDNPKVLVAVEKLMEMDDVPIGISRERILKEATCIALSDITRAVVIQKRGDKYELEPEEFSTLPYDVRAAIKRLEYIEEEMKDGRKKTRVVVECYDKNRSLDLLAKWHQMGKDGKGPSRSSGGSEEDGGDEMVWTGMSLLLADDNSTEEEESDETEEGEEEIDFEEEVEI